MPRTISVPSASEIAKKWVDVTPARAGYYEEATPAAAAEWEAAASAAGATYKAGISVAGIEKRFVGGIKRAGAAKFKRKVESVGVGRYSPGVSAAEADMAAGFGPFRDVLDGLVIPDRGPRGAATNYAIVKTVGDALYKKRLAVLAATS